MPRLSNRIYYKRYQLLRALWLDNYRYYSYLMPGDQRAIHDYFQPSKDLTVEDLVAHRQAISKERPTLAHRAGKASQRMNRLVETDRIARVKKQPQPQPAKVPRGQRQIHVRAVLRPEPDLKALCRALIALAEHQTREEMEKRKAA